MARVPFEEEGGRDTQVCCPPGVPDFSSLKVSSDRLEKIH